MAADLPKRRHQLVLNLGADSIEALRQALDQVAFDLREGGNAVVTGSPSSGGHWTHKVDADQTAEGYREQLAAYLAAEGGRA